MGLRDGFKNTRHWKIPLGGYPPPKTDISNIEDRYSKFDQEILDGFQLAYKITANSLYGQIGARTSPIYWKEIAAATTATGTTAATASNATSTTTDASKVKSYLF